MRVDSHTQIRQAMRVLIHTHISCRPLVEGSAPKPLLNTEFHSVATRSPNAFLSAPGALFRGMGCVNPTPLLLIWNTLEQRFSLSLCQQQQERGTLLSLPTRRSDQCCLTIGNPGIPRACPGTPDGPVPVLLRWVRSYILRTVHAAPVRPIFLPGPVGFPRHSHHHMIVSY